MYFRILRKFLPFKTEAESQVFAQPSDVSFPSYRPCPLPYFSGRAVGVLDCAFMVYMRWISGGAPELFSFK